MLSTKSGHVYEKELVLKYLRENDGRDPITGDMLAETDLVEIKTGTSSSFFSPPPSRLITVGPRAGPKRPQGVRRTTYPRAR